METVNKVSVKEIRNMVFERLDEIHRSLEIGVKEGDLFELGINFRLDNEEAWLLNLLEKLG